ncbi:MAG: glycoside hydrolase family 127 protein [Kiritimatiellae bacterium]|nr:glycoside hydrolase family 127 protein [Kiritimatiellia bacterium]
MKRLYVAVPAVFVAALVASAADSDSLGNIGDVRLKGYLGERLDAMIERHVIGTDVDYITAPFLEKTERKGWWQTEFWGKYMHSAMPYLAYTGAARLRDSVERGVERILASQEPNGYIGNYPDELCCGEGWDVWGMKYTMMGLLHYYDMASRPSSVVPGQDAVVVLDAAKRLCDYVIGELGPSGKRGVRHVFAVSADGWRPNRQPYFLRGAGAPQDSRVEREDDGKA